VPRLINMILSTIGSVKQDAEIGLLLRGIEPGKISSRGFHPSQKIMKHRGPRARGYRGATIESVENVPNSRLC